MARAGCGCLGILLLAPVFLVLGLIILMGGGSAGGGGDGVPDWMEGSGDMYSCPGPGRQVLDLSGVSYGRYTPTQIENAGEIVRAGWDAGVSYRDQVIGVMTALGESGLEVLDHGDDAGPDSRGLFQQRDNGAWGTLEDRMDPYKSAEMFFDALKKIPDRNDLDPIQVAHRVQGNADPNHYLEFWISAAGITAAVTGGQDCSLTGPPRPDMPDSGLAGWSRPLNELRVSSSYGYRNHPVTGEHKFHSGTDFVAACHTPIYAASGGEVTFSGAMSGYGWLIEIHNKDTNVTTRYAHMYADEVLVSAGDTVWAGQTIAAVGSNGRSTGCHLHFEVKLAGERVDPVPVLADNNIEVKK